MISVKKYLNDTNGENGGINIHRATKKTRTAKAEIAYSKNNEDYDSEGSNRTSATIGDGQ